MKRYINLLFAAILMSSLLLTGQVAYADTANSSNQTSQDTKSNDGWQTKAGNRYYLKNNQPTIGLKKIDNSWYLFDNQGVMLKGLQKVKQGYSYFGQDGKLKTKNTKTKKAYYWINKSGKIIGIKNYAKVISQLPEMPTGCEITAVTMMLNFAGKKVTKKQAAKIMPRSSNPNKGFIGSPYKEFPLGIG